MRKIKIPRIVAWYFFFLLTPFFTGDCYIPTTYIVGPSYAYIIGDCGNPLFHNIARVGAFPADVEQIMSIYCRQNDRVLYPFTIREVLFHHSPSLYQWPSGLLKDEAKKAFVLTTVESLFDSTVQFDPSFLTDFHKKHPGTVFIRMPMAKLARNMEDEQLHKFIAFDASLDSFIAEHPELPILDVSKDWEEKDFLDTWHLNDQALERLRSQIIRALS